jgi:N-methylhydantoinase A
MTYIVGIDIGGTFTDGVAIEVESSRVTVGKRPTTYPDPFRGVFETLEELAGGHDTSTRAILESCVKLVHATTLTTNVLLERSGARVGLVATQGFADALLMMSGKGRVAGLSLIERRHFRTTDKPDPIVPRERIVEVPERVDSDGDVVVPLVSESVARALASVEALELEACAIGLLWSFRHPEHEQLIAAALRQRFPDLYVASSSDLAPLVGEYERTATAVVDCYVGPAVRGYLAKVETELQRLGLSSRLLVVQSSGGVATLEQISPVKTIESGPAAGVRGSVHILDQLDVDDAIVTDVGGTTFKVSILKDRSPAFATETVIGQYSLLVPMIDIVSIGAGGGSIAWIDGDRLRVGPRSAGSSPGPACYGWGGEEPTVTDADLVLGYLNPDYFLGGRMKLSVEQAEQAIRSRIAEPLFGGDVIRAAAGIREIVDSQMADLIRKATVERGHDPRSFVVIAYGGSGPVHCGAYAAELGCREIVIPPNATVHSAFGAAVSDLHHSFQLARQGPAPGVADGIRADFVTLEDRARELLASEGIEESRLRLSLWADLRYRRQFHELRVPVPGPAASLAEAELRAVIEGFQDEYTRRYGAGARHGEDRIEYVRFGIDALGETPRPTTVLAPAEAAEPQSKAIRSVFWREAGAMLETPVYEGARLSPGGLIDGPALIEEEGTTIVVHPQQRARIDAHLNTIVEIGGRPDALNGRSRHL